MTDIGPGDWVECIDATPNKKGDIPPFIEGCIDKVKKVLMSRTGRPILTLTKYSHDVPGRRYQGFRLSRFRPIYRPNTDALLHSLFETNRVPEEEFTQ